MQRATAGELYEVECFLFEAHLGIRIGRLYALVRDRVTNRLVRELNLQLYPSYFYQIWEIAGEKLRMSAELTLLETVWLRWFEGLLRAMGAKVHDEDLDRDMDLDQYLDWHYYRYVRMEQPGSEGCPA